MIPIHLPSLAERREDIRALALHFVSRANQAHQHNVNLSPDALAPLVRDYAPAQSHSVLVLQTALAEHHGNQSRAAQSLGLTLRQFTYRLRKAGLK